MCGRCEGDPYRGVKSLFNGDLQAGNTLEDRADWIVPSPRIAVYLGRSALKNEDRPLISACGDAINLLTLDELITLAALSESLTRPMF